MDRKEDDTIVNLENFEKIDHVSELEKVLKEENLSKYAERTIRATITKFKQEKDDFRRVGRDELMHTIDALTHPFYIINTEDYQLNMLNLATKKLYKSTEDINTCYALTHGGSRPCSEYGENCPVEEVKKTRKSVIVEHQHFDSDGNVRILELYCHPIFDKEGNINQVMEYSIDITGRKQIEKALLESEERLRSFMDSATDAFVLLDSKLHVVEVNRIALNTVGLERKDMINKYYGDIVPGFEESKSHVNYLRVLKSGNSIVMTEYVSHPEYGSKKYDVKIFKVGDGIGVIATDITEFKLVEQALKANEENLRQVIQNMPVMLDAFDENNQIIVWNRECERVTGYSAEEMIGDPNALEKIYPDQKYLSRLLKEWSEKGDEFYNWETDITHKDGTTKNVTWSNITKHFLIPGWKSWAVGFDITDRKKMEDELLEKRKLAALGQMAAGLAHELNTPLANINLTTDYLMSFANNNKINTFDINPVMNELKDIKEQIKYCGQIIKNLLHFSRKIEISKSNLNLNSFFTEIVSSPSLESAITEKNIDIIMEISKSATLNGDKVLLGQSFQNLIINSIDAMISSQTDPTIKISVLENDEGLEISIKDNGRGIKEEYLPRIFDPFFTTKEVGHGTGLGLSITRGIIEKHKGEITVKSIFGEGTEILVVLPRTSS